MDDIREPVSEAEDPAGNGEAEGWTWRTAVDKADAFIKRHELPAPSRPTGLGQEYDFPTDPRSLTSEKLGATRLRLSAFHGYTLYLIGREDVELEAFSTVYELMLGDAMDKVQRRAEKRLVTDVLKAVTITNHEVLRRLTRAVTERRARVGRLKAQLAVYEAHLAALSREQSRREMEARAGVD